MICTYLSIYFNKVAYIVSLFRIYISRLTFKHFIADNVNSGAYETTRFFSNYFHEIIYPSA
jgi:hypothetical protein